MIDTTFVLLRKRLDENVRQHTLKIQCSNILCKEYPAKKDSTNLITSH